MSSALDWNSENRHVFLLQPKGVTVTRKGNGAVKSGEADRWVTGWRKVKSASLILVISRFTLTISHELPLSHKIQREHT